jgi:hypothetical protein
MFEIPKTIPPSAIAINVLEGFIKEDEIRNVVKIIFFFLVIFDAYL